MVCACDRRDHSVPQESRRSSLSTSLKRTLGHTMTNMEHCSKAERLSLAEGASRVANLGERSAYQLSRQRARKRRDGGFARKNGGGAVHLPRSTLSRSDWRPHSDTWLATARLRAEYRVSCRPDRNGIGAVASARSLWITGSSDRTHSLRAAFGLASAARRHPLGRERLRVCLDAAFLHDVVVAGAESLRAR